MPQSKVNGFITSTKTRNNACTNPGFEDTSFYLGQATYSTELKRSGTRSAKIVGTGGGQWAYLSTSDVSTVPQSVAPGDVVYMEAWLYGSPSNTIASSGFYLYAQGLDGTLTVNLENLHA